VGGGFASDDLFGLKSPVSSFEKTTALVSPPRRDPDHVEISRLLFREDDGLRWGRVGSAPALLKTLKSPVSSFEKTTQCVEDSRVRQNQLKSPVSSFEKTTSQEGREETGVDVVEISRLLFREDDVASLSLLVFSSTLKSPVSSFEKTTCVFG